MDLDRKRRVVVIERFVMQSIAFAIPSLPCSVHTHSANTRGGGAGFCRSRPSHTRLFYMGTQTVAQGSGRIAPCIPLGHQHQLAGYAPVAIPPWA